MRDNNVDNIEGVHEAAQALRNWLVTVRKAEAEVFVYDRCTLDLTDVKISQVIMTFDWGTESITHVIDKLMAVAMEDVLVVSRGKVRYKVTVVGHKKLGRAAFSLYVPFDDDEIEDLEAPGLKNDSGKLRFSLLPLDALREIVRVLMKGAEKYAEGNWQYVADARKRYYDAMLRHVTAWHEGERNDPEWGLHHLAHAGCCVLFLLALSLRGRIDNE